MRILTRRPWLTPLLGGASLVALHLFAPDLHRSGLVTAAPRPESAPAAPARSASPPASAPAAAKGPASTTAQHAPRKATAAPAARPKKQASVPSPRRPASPSARRPAAPAPAVAYRKVVAAGVPLHIVQVDLRRRNVHVGIATARNGVGFYDTWSGIIDRTRPTAAITGTYFGIESAIPVGSIVVGGRVVHRGLVGTAFTFTRAGKAQLVACRPGTDYDWSAYETVLRAGPRLLSDGKRTLAPHAEGFRDPAIFARKKRTAVAITRHGKLLFVAVQKPVLLRTLAEALRSLGVTDAMCLDGGSSTGLYYRGKSHVVPNRSLTNLLVVYDTTANYRQHAALLAPRGARIAGGGGRM